MTYKKNFVFLSLCFLLVACGENSSSSSSAKKEVQEEVSLRPGTYSAFLRPMNSKVNGFITSGRADITVDESFSIKLIMDDAPGVVHVQRLYSGTACPTLTADTNRDGFVDYVEAEAVLGRSILSLDGDLSSDSEGIDLYPVGKTYSYQQKADLSMMPSDLTLEGRVILIHGAYSGVLPPSVNSRAGLTPAQSLPIACGKLFFL